MFSVICVSEGASAAARRAAGRAAQWLNFKNKHFTSGKPLALELFK